MNTRSVAACEVHYARSGRPEGAAVVLAPSLGTEAIQGARLEVVPGAAHLANIEQPSVVGELVAGHLGAN